MFIDNTKIYYVEKFLTDEELDFFDQRAASFVPPEKAGDESGYASVSERIHDIYTSHEPPKILRDINARLDKLSREIYDIPPNCVLQGIHNFHMLYPPLKMQHHWDGTTPGVHFGIVVYVSDPESYDGGKIDYSNQKISIKPARGSAVFHPATEEYLHGVEQVTRGVRVALSTFIQEKEHVGGPGNHDGSEEVRR